ncbi:MAG: HEAT repeat domain-containing protein [Gemmataceae bacterium]|nr:HEAT repeat domain-containing protein [Gemmataceae bacterium]
MQRRALFVTLALLPALALSAQADGILGLGLFSKKPKSNPAQRVPELIAILKADQNERNRAGAAEELGRYEAAMFAELPGVLADALRNDPSASVRIEAASSLAALRPVTSLAGQALDKAAASDESWRVRWHAKGVLVRYRLAGYSSTKVTLEHGAGMKTDEPPLLVDPGVPPPAQFPAGTPAKKGPALAPPVKGSNALPLVPPKGIEKKDTTVPDFRSVPRPLPKGPGFSTAEPQKSNVSPPGPLPLIEDGPVLVPTPPPMKNAAPMPDKSPF